MKTNQVRSILQRIYCQEPRTEYKFKLALFLKRIYLDKRQIP